MTTNYSKEELRLLIPDYINGNLDPDTRTQIAAYVKEDAAGAAELELWASLLEGHDAIRSQNPEPAPPGLDGFLAYAKSHPIDKKAEKHGESWWARLLHPKNTWVQPAIATAFVIFGVQEIVLPALMPLVQNNGRVPHESSNHTEADFPANLRRGLDKSDLVKADIITVAFSPGTTEEQLRELLLSLDARIVDGPVGQLGDYQLAVRNGQGKGVTEALVKSGKTLSATLMSPRAVLKRRQD